VQKNINYNPYLVKQVW